jgi:hypothetical protein
MSKKEPISELAAFLGEKYAVESQKVVENNVRLSTKLAAMLCMFESYYTEFSQNQRELIRLVDVATSEKAFEAKDFDHIKQIKRTSKNKLNRIKNQDARFDKFFKEFNTEFTKYFGDGTREMSGTLLDAFDAFWNTVVRIDEKSVGINKEFLTK